MKGSSVFLDKSTSRHHHLAGFGGHRHCGSGNVMVLICQVISKDQVKNRSCNFIARCLSR